MSQTKKLAEGSKLNPLTKLTKFLHLQRLERQKSGHFLLFGGKSKSAKPNKVVEIANIKKVAKGAASVAATDRMYLWVLYINQNEENLANINVERERKGVWVLKAWSVGRALDLVSDVLGIMNHNNLTQQSTERLNLFQVKDDKPILLETSKKVCLTLSSGDIVYLVKGSMS